MPESPAPAPASSANDIKGDIVALMPSLRAFSRSLCPNPARADDLVQETLLKAITNLHRFEPGSNLRAWLFTILRNTFYSELRKRQREVEDAEGAHAARLAQHPNQPGVADMEDFKLAFAQLSADHREVLALIGAAGASYEEAAEICGCAVGTVKSRVNRARARLAELLGMTLEEASAPISSELLPLGVIAGNT
jgi:RNA polymerase sigma-70 factor (ECF subfamily)